MFHQDAHKTNAKRELREDYKTLGFSSILDPANVRKNGKNIFGITKGHFF